MSVFIELEEWLEWFSRNRARVDMTMAAAAGVGLCMMGLVLLKFSTLDRVNPLDFRGAARVVMLTTLPYLFAGMIVHWLWITRLRRRVPSWVMIALLGSLLLVVSAGAFRFYRNALASDATTTTFETIGAFILDRAKDGLGVFVVLSLFTLPITAAIYYAESIVRGARRWHEGVEPPSILRDQER